MDKSGGRPKKETSGFAKKETSGYVQKKPNVNENVNVNDNENVNDNGDVSDSCVDGLQEIIDFYNNNIGVLTPYGLNVLEDYSKEMQVELIILAMKKSVEANKKTIQYIKGILNNWSKKGIKTLLEAENEDKNFKEQKASKENKDSKKTYQNYEQRKDINFNELYAN